MSGSPGAFASRKLAAYAPVLANRHILGRRKTRRHERIIPRRCSLVRATAA